MRRIGLLADGWIMDAGALNQAIGGLAVRNVNVSLLAQLLDQQRAAGVAALQLIEGGGQPGRGAAPAPASEAAPAPVRGAAEPGKGQHVDVLA